MAETHAFAAGQLRAIVERIERIEADIAEMNADKSDIYKEAKSNGFDVKAIRAIVAERRKDPAELQELDAIIDIYRSALSGTPHAHAHAGDAL